MLMKVMALALLALSVVDARHAYNKVTKSGELPVVGYLRPKLKTIPGIRSGGEALEAVLH